jgi:hypothetical protein
MIRFRRAASVAILVCVSALVAQPSATDGRKPRLVPAAPLIDRFLAPDSRPLVSYRALRRLHASTRGGRMQATIEAWTTLDPVKGFSYEIVSEEGSALIRRRVLIAALEAERKAIGSSDESDAALTRANYEFPQLVDASDDLTKVDVKPRRKHIMLIDGSLFLKSDSADLVRIEGELSKRPSFWTRRVRIVREYARVDGVHVPMSMRSNADVLIVGDSSFSMTYQYAEINGRKIDNSQLTTHN